MNDQTCVREIEESLYFEIETEEGVPPACTEQHC
jgi:DNA-dependent RNA polymerase auxiliary subunit epsilon